MRSGTYALRANGFTNKKQADIIFQSANANGPFYFRSYFRVDTLPSAENAVMTFLGTGGSFLVAYITIDSGGALRLYDEDGVIGSPSSALSTTTWYMLEIGVDRTAAAGSHVVTGRLEGSTFATASNRNLSQGVEEATVGTNATNTTQTQGDWYFDDLAINDSTGSFQNSWPSVGSIIHLKPNAAGDSNGFLVQVGGTAGATNNYTRVNEVTPDDATTYNGSAVLNAEDLFNCGDSGIASGSIINVVAVGVRMADLVSADATAAFKLELEKTGSGTKSQSGTLTPNSTSWITNAAANPRNYPLTTYQDPDSANWTQTTLDSMQIGYIQTVTNAQTIAVSNIWALVDYAPAPTPAFISSRFLTGLGA